MAPRQQALAELVDVALYAAGVGVEEVGHHEEAQLLWWRVIGAHGGTSAAAAAAAPAGVVRRSPLVSRCGLGPGVISTSTGAVDRGPASVSGPAANWNTCWQLRVRALSELDEQWCPSQRGTGCKPLCCAMPCSPR